MPAAFEQTPPANAPALAGAPTGGRALAIRSLTALIDDGARRSNLDIAQAAARLRQADARARQAGAALLPTVGLNGDVQHALRPDAAAPRQHETDYSAGAGRQL